MTAGGDTDISMCMNATALLSAVRAQNAAMVERHAAMPQTADEAAAALAFRIDGRRILRNEGHGWTVLGTYATPEKAAARAALISQMLTSEGRAFAMRAV